MAGTPDALVLHTVEETRWMNATELQAAIEDRPSLTSNGHIGCDDSPSRVAGTIGHPGAHVPTLTVLPGNGVQS